MLSCPYQFHKPISITCLHKHSYWPLFNAPTQTYINSSSSTCNKVSFFFISLPKLSKHGVLSIGATGFDEPPPLSKHMVPSVEYDDDVEGGEEIDAFSVPKKELPPWGEVEDGGLRDSGTVDTTLLETKEMGVMNEHGVHFLEEMDDDDDDVESVEGGEEVDAFFVPKKELPPWGEVEDDGDRHYRTVDNSLLASKEMGLMNEHGVHFLQETDEDDDDDDDDDEEEYVVGGEDVDAHFVPKKELPPWGEVEDDGCRDSSTVDTTLLEAKEMGVMNEHGVHFLEETDENVLSNRILVLSRTNKIRSAMEYFRSMELLGLCPNIHACNSLMSSLLRNGWFVDCLKVFNFTRTRKITTGHTYSLILMAHVKAQGCDSALKFFRELESECDVEKDFDAVVYNTVISICRKVNNWSEMERIWRSMKANGCAGTHVTYHLLVNSFVHCGQSELALYAYHEMVQNGFEPNNNTLHAIIAVFAKEGKWDAALSVFQKMLTVGLKPNLVACNALINSLGRAGELKLASQVYDTMKSLGHKPDAYTFNALLSSLNKANRHQEAIQLFEMIERNQTCQFNIHIYNTVLISCSKLGLWDRALEILWQIEASGLSDLTVSYNLVIRACELARKPTIALQVYEHMVHQMCSPDIFTYLSIIRCCVHGGLWEELEEILNLAMPSATLYNAAVQGMCLRGKVNLANKVYTKMLESGLQPNVKTQVLMHSMIRK